MKRILRRTAVVSLVLLLGLAVVVLWAGGRLVAPTPRSIGPPPSDLPAETVAIASGSGSTLAGWFVPGQPGMGTIVLLHPIHGCRLSMLGRAGLFWQNGYSVLLIDMQAHGESPGEHITLGYLESRDALAAVQFAREHKPNEPIGVVGFSLGGAAALLGSPPLEVDAIIVECVFATIEEAVANRVRMRLGPLTPIASPLLLGQLRPRLGISPSSLRPIDHVADLAAPIMVLAGSDDQRTTIDESCRLYENACEPKRLVVVEGANHQDLYKHSPKLYEEQVLAFLREHMHK